MLTQAQIALVCFFLSGASSLILELVWTRELTLVFGSTTLAMSTVLSVFMGGLALGSYLAGRVADRLRERLRAYAAIEITIGLYALVVPLALAHYPAVNAALYRAFADHPLGLSLGRFAATAVLLLLPTTLMGATLPILARHFAPDAAPRGQVGRLVGTLYAVNTFGAVAGTFAAGFVLLPRFGVYATNLTAAATNLTLATLVLLARRRPLTAALDTSGLDLDLNGEPLDPLPPVAAPPSELARRLVLVTFAVSGGTAMIFQVLWTRALAVVIGSSVYSFTLILLAFLIGLAGGATAAAQLAPRVRRPLLWLAGVHLGVAAAVAMSYFLMDRLPSTFLGLLRGGAFSVDGILFCQFVLAALAILPATLVLGCVLPFSVHVYARGEAGLGRDVGSAYALNTLGAITGSAAAGFVVLPLLGLERGLKLGMLSSLCLGAALLACEPASRLRRVAGAGLALALGVGLVAALPRWSLEHFSAGLFRVAIAKDIIEQDRWQLPHLEYYKDGIATTVSVERWGKTLALKNNGKVDASNGDDMATQVMVGLMPLVFHPTALEKPPRVAVIGFGSGVTIGAVTQFPIAHADVVELEPAVVEAGSRFFGPWSHSPEHDPRVHVLIGDGRNFLTQSTDRYDVIVSEPSNPWITGVSNLFTTDYWRLARERLADDGVFCQWAQLYEMSPINIKTILRSFSEVFPYTYVFSAEDLSSDVIMVATKRPLLLDLDRLRKNFVPPVLRAELERGGVRSAEDLVAYLLLTPDELPAFTAGAPINTDDNARIEFAAPRDLLGSLRHDPYLARVYGTDWPYGRFERLLTGLGSGADRAATELRLARALLAHGKRQAAGRHLEMARSFGAAADDRVIKLYDLLGEKPLRDVEVPLTAPTEGDPNGLEGLDPPRLPPGLSAKDQTRFATDHLELEKAAQARMWGHALKAVARWPDAWVEGAGPDLSLTLGFLLYKAGLLDDAADRLKPLVDDAAYTRRRPALFYYLARAEYGDAIYEPAVRYMERYIDATRVAPPPP